MPEELSTEVPKNLLDLVESEDTALEIARICFENGIKEEEKIREVGYQTGRVLLGDLSPEKFRESLEENVKISAFMAGKIAREINDTIFYPVKASLEELYKIEMVPIAGVPVKPPVKKVEEKSEERPKRMDVYREPIE